MQAKRVFENAAEEFLGQKAGVLGKEAEDEAIEKTRDAQVFPLGHGDFGAALCICQFGSFATLKRAGDFGNLAGESFGDLGGSALWLEGIRVLE